MAIVELCGLALMLAAVATVTPAGAAFLAGLVMVVWAAWRDLERRAH